MKEFCNKHKRLLIDIAILAGLFLFVTIAFLVLKPFYFRPYETEPYINGTARLGVGSVDGIIPKVFIYICLLGVIITGCCLKVKNKLTIERLFFLIFLVGVLLQLLYMLMTPVNYRQHDINVNSPYYPDALYGGFRDGHEAYAWTLYSTGKLPTLLDGEGHLSYQFYHPPLNAFMQSTFMHIGKGLMSFTNFIAGKQLYQVDNRSAIFQTSEVLSTFYMNVAIYFGIKIAYKLKIEKRFKIFAALFISFFPALIILAGQVNNDPLCVMNCFIVIYFTIKWWEKHSYFNACMIGLFTGLAMFAKLSGALIAIPAMVAYIIVFVQAIRKKESFKHFIFQALIIGAIAAPLGLWFHIYAAMKFNQPFGFVFSNLNDQLYKGNYNFFQRFINIFDFGDLFGNIWGNTFVNYNMPNFLIKSAIFGEYGFSGADALAGFALVLNYLFVYASLVLMVIYFIKSGKEHLEIKIIAGTLVISQLLAQLYFNIKMPYGCTMDFRYIVPIIIGFMILDALAADKFVKENDWKKYFSIVTCSLGVLFIASSTAFYLTMF